MPTIATTIISSISVKPWATDLLVLLKRLQALRSSSWILEFTKMFRIVQ